MYKYYSCVYNLYYCSVNCCMLFCICLHAVVCLLIFISCIPSLFVAALNQLHFTEIMGNCIK